jgi:hypothetical protein
MDKAKNSMPKATEFAGRLAKREFLKDVGRTGIGLAAVAGAGGRLNARGTAPSPGDWTDKIPQHLPRRLTIAGWFWNWFVATMPGEAFDDLDRVFVEHVERSYNAIRVDVGLNWCFNQQGRPRGPIEILPWFSGLPEDVMQRFGARDGVRRYDVLERVLKMYELAKKHNIYIIQTSWEYQDSTTHLGDPKLREDVFSTPEDIRLERLANMHDRLIQELKKRGLEKQIAFVEIHNELNASYFPQGWLAQKPLVEKVLGRLQQAHPDILFTADYANVGPVFEPKFPGYQALPENMQVAGHHVYTLGVEKALHDLTNTWLGDQVPPDPKDNELLRWLIGSRPRISWEEWSKAAARIRRLWWPFDWLRINLDVDRYDYWMYEHFGEYAEMMNALIQAAMRDWGVFSRQRGLPAVIDEGYIFCPPLFSQFEYSAAGRLISENVVDTAIEQAYWGVMLSTYIGPIFPIWKQNPGWIKKTNERFLKSVEV